MEDTKAIRREVGPMEWLDDGQDLDASALQANVGPPSSGHSIGSLDFSLREPPRLACNVGYFRQRAEHFGDLCAEMIAEGLEGIAYGSAKRAAHFGRVANDLYSQRAKELIAAHPEWLVPLVLGFLSLFAAIPAQADVLDGLLVGSAVADLYTTERGLRMPGLYERNPVMANPVARVGVKGAVLALTLASAHELKRAGHPRASRVVKIAVIALWSGAAVNNAIQIRRAR